MERAEPGTHPVSLDGGSLSDSGISDGGSDWGFSERERRLGALRRLHRQLELALAPGSAALLAITKRMEQAESELRSLQQACRELVARTAVQGETVHRITADMNMRRGSNGSSNASSQGRSPNGGKRKTKRRQAQSVTVPAVTILSEPAKGDLCTAGGPDDDPGSSPTPARPGWAKRVARAALPLQLALVAVFCAACLLEPHCCDSMNTWTMSLAPQLRYVRGPPPV
ncbi:uncharacterized protein LOC113386977 [Ctenocephalides felis]|uniref:uncharacterized protein LOC113386977 n=1 Tax=Ctenocephalides felis TaxID=7515 RepID=UPI000E6E498B|nr:uncharacterized protein LOC113386977 [Ctenocephalides felis]